MTPEDKKRDQEKATQMNAEIRRDFEALSRGRTVDQDDLRFRCTGYWHILEADLREKARHTFSVTESQRFVAIGKKNWWD